MVKHIVMWKLLDSYSEAEKQEIKSVYKEKIEALSDLMDGVLKVKIEINALATSNVDILLDSEFANQDVFNAYRTHPKHLEAASYLNGKIVSRNAMDYEI